MDLGLAFDDDDLNTSKDKNSDINVSYCVKKCTSQWFESVADLFQSDFPHTSEFDPQQIPHTFKFSGDFHYHWKNYDKARDRYQRALELLPTSNVSVRQDVKESLCRCYLYCGQTNESLQMARDLVLEMASEDDAHQRQALILLSAVCEKASRWAECVECLEKLCANQPSFAQFWDQLGDAYMKLLVSPLTEEETYKTGEALFCNGGTNLGPHLVKALTCYIRASLLFQSVMGFSSNLIKTRNESWISKISQKMDNIPFSVSEKAFALQQIQREIENQDELWLENKSEARISTPKDDESSTTESSDSQLFYNKFCSWYIKSQT